MSKRKRRAPVNKNETITLSFEDLTREGNGVGKVDGYPLFVPNVLPGEKAKVKVVRVNRNFGYGKLLHIIKESPERVDPPCDVYEQCGGCQLQHMSYSLQLQMKQDQVENVINKISHLDDVIIHPTIGMDDPWRYRNNVQIPVGEKNGELITGFYQRRSHRIVDNMETCIIQDEAGDDAIAEVRQIANRLGIDAYNEQTHRGTLRHIMVRTGRATNEIMIVIITKTAKLPHKDVFIKELTEAFPNVKSIIHNVNSKKTNVIFGDETNVIWGEEYLYDKIDDLTFAISARSFYQVNPEQTKVLYDKTLEYANISNDDIVIDAYCGIGTISLFLAKEAKKVYGVEIVPQAVNDANQNAKINNITNAEFVVGAAEKIMPWWTAQGLRPNVIIVDPPRKGCDEALLQAMIDMQPERIVYVSCNPSTLARDLRILADGGYKAKEIQPVDMFAQTGHVESVVRVERES